MSLTKMFIFRCQNALALILLLLAVALSFWPFVEVISGTRSIQQDQMTLNGTDSFGLLTTLRTTVQPEYKIPDLFRFRISGFFPTGETQITVSGLRLSEKHEIKKGSNGFQRDRDVEFHEKYPDHVHEVITSYAFSYPLTTGEGDYGGWLYFDKNDKLLASRPIKGLGDADEGHGQNFMGDERYAKKWEGKELVDTKGAKIDNVCGTEGFMGSKQDLWARRGLAVQRWALFKWGDVKEYCWTPKCLMIEDDQGSKNDGCWLFKLEDDSYRAYVPVPPESGPQKSCSTQYLTCAPFLFLSLFLSML